MTDEMMTVRARFWKRALTLIRHQRCVQACGDCQSRMRHRSSSLLHLFLARPIERSRRSRSKHQRETTMKH
jgi:hypothetical protein